MSELSVWTSPENFGDLLGPEILKRLGYQVRITDRVDEADLIACGSIIDAAAQWLKPGCIVWGSGLMHPGPVDLAHLDVRAVRGKLSASVLGLDVPTGDPGILVPRLWERPPVRRAVGVVRHWIDPQEYPWVPDQIHTRRPVDEVIDFIGSCERVLSSSLHGLIVAQAWGIPCVRIHCPEVLGGNFKWMDWMSGDTEPDDLVGLLP